MTTPWFYSRERGFTLMEIVIALAVAGILVAVAVPLYRDYATKAVVTDALAVAEEGRVAVELALAEGRDVGKELNALMAAANSARSGAIQLRWDATREAIVATANIPTMGTRTVLALVRKDGDWRCVPAQADKMMSELIDPKYLPASCRDSAPMSAPKTAPLAGAATPSSAPAAAPTCPPDQEMVTLPTGSACTPKCAAGNERDKANPTQCKAIVCGPNEEKIPDRGCLAIPPKPDCGAGNDAFRGYSASNDPTWSCMTACPPGQMPGKAFRCIADPNAKPAPAATPAATPPAKPAAAPVIQTPPVQLASIKCRSCIAGAEDACEVLHEEITCTEPNNYCVTFVDNQDDGSKIVKRGCANFERVRVEWYQGTSDDDKCRERINVQQNLAFTCTFGCTTDNCNDNLRPSTESLYQPN